MEPELFSASIWGEFRLILSARQTWNRILLSPHVCTHLTDPSISSNPSYRIRAVCVCVCVCVCARVRAGGRVCVYIETFFCTGAQGISLFKAIAAETDLLCLALVTLVRCFFIY